MQVAYCRKVAVLLDCLYLQTENEIDSVIPKNV